MNILVTGGLGYIGSHVVIELISNGFKVEILDNLSNSDIHTLQKLEVQTKTKIPIHVVDLRHLRDTKKVFINNRFDGVIHFAGLKAVGDSVVNPEIYYENNVLGTINLINAMKEISCKKLIFSSSATVYGKPKKLPIEESSELQAINPYGENKIIIEKYLNYLHKSDKEWRFSILRYFNPVGGHHSKLFGENPKGTPNNLMPFICQVAAGKIEKLKIFGNDFKTHDGTGIRDYIHVVDLARGHTAALNYILKNADSITVNLGTGKGYSVLEMVNAFTEINQILIPFEYTCRRPGDIDSCYADNSLAKKILSWEPKYDLFDMCRDSWESQKNINNLTFKKCLKN